MPPTMPPTTAPGHPRRHVLPAGTSLWRVHRSGAAPHEFDPPRMTSGWGGGRFDSVGPDGYPYLYASVEPGTALAERFVRDLDFSVTGDRLLRRRSLEARSVSVITTTVELDLLRLTSGPDLASIGQDDWLLSARADEFDLTRRWAWWLRGEVRWAKGIVWQSSIDFPNCTTVLFGDACGPHALESAGGMTERLDDPDREGWLRHQLAPHAVKLHPPLPQEKPKVFINYRSDNGGLAAEWLDEELTRRLGRAAVFLDKRSLRPGATFPPELVDKARNCRVLLVVAGRGWENAARANGERRLDDEDDWVRREIREASGYPVAVVPVLVGARERMAADDLPADIRFVADNQYLHLRDGYDKGDVSRMVDQLLARFPGLDA